MTQRASDDHILDPEVQAWVRPYYEDIDQVEAVDTYMLRVRMQEPSGALPMVSPKGVEKYGADWKRHPIGTGPFMMKEWIPGEHVLLVKNPHYFTMIR